MIGDKQRKEMQTSIRKGWLLDKAAMVFWQKGYHASMKDIAKACNCKPANLYNYFKNKEDILYEVIRNITEQGVSSILYLKEDEKTNPVEQLRQLINTHFGFLASLEQSNVLISDTGMRHLSREHQKEIIRLRDLYDSILRKIISRGIDAGYFAPIDDKIVSYLIGSVIVRSSLWFSTKGRLSIEEVSDIMFNFVYNGIRDGKPNQPETTPEPVPELQPETAEPE
ncbi:MAG: HTH-type transcriptional repressor KstR2 [Pelotomaculum sp. PtaB.Bin104]|nr:MAG: HTH-type transcriptional repressor KstR2 [Pelotomaculum sp. PtaB.Bin104]